MRKFSIRQAHLGLYTLPLIQGIEEKFDANQLQTVLREEHLNFITILAKGHHGSTISLLRRYDTTGPGGGFWSHWRYSRC